MRGGEGARGRPSGGVAFTREQIAVFACPAVGRLKASSVARGLAPFIETTHPPPILRAILMRRTLRIVTEALRRTCPPVAAVGATLARALLAVEGVAHEVVGAGLVPAAHFVGADGADAVIVAKLRALALVGGVAGDDGADAGAAHALGFAAVGVQGAGLSKWHTVWEDVRATVCGDIAGCGGVALGCVAVAAFAVGGATRGQQND